MLRYAIIGLVRGHKDFSKYKNLIIRNQYIKNYLTKFPENLNNTDCVIFHEGNISEEQQKYIITESNMTLNFVNIRKYFDNWDVSELEPSSKSRITTNEEEFDGKNWSFGYRNMCKFYFITLPQIMSDMKYDYYMRLDDDSFLLDSNIDIFKFMSTNEYDYGYVKIDEETHNPTNKSLIQYLKDTFTNIESNKFMINDKLFMYYTSIFVTKTAYWLRHDVMNFMNEIDKTNNIYNIRWGDAPLHFITLNLFESKTILLPNINYYHKSGHLKVKT